MLAPDRLMEMPYIGQYSEEIYYNIGHDYRIYAKIKHVRDVNAVTGVWKSCDDGVHVYSRFACLRRGLMAVLNGTINGRVLEDSVLYPTWAASISRPYALAPQHCRPANRVGTGRTMPGRFRVAATITYIR